LKKTLKNAGKFFFPHILLFDSKLDHNSALHAKIREKSLLIDSRIDFRQGKNYFLPTLVFDFKTRSQFRSACKNQREISSNKVRRLLWPLGGGNAGKGGEMV